MIEFYGDQSEWLIERGDYSVGIFGDVVVHQTCVEEFNLGTTHETFLGESHTQGSNPMYSITTAGQVWQVTCQDCKIVGAFYTVEFV